MSIFQKDCPQCTAPNPVSAALCACGHCFDPAAVTDKKAAVDVAIHEERLYHDYLAAREIQAEAVYEVARADALANPDDTYAAAQALAAEQALNAARAELRIQAQKTLHLKRSPVQTTPTAPNPARASRSTVRTRATKRKPAVQTPARASQPSIATAAVASPKIASPPVVKPATAPAPIATATPTPAPSAKPVPAAMPIITTVAPQPAAPKPSAQPNQAFRVRQAKMAEAIVRNTVPASPTPSATSPARAVSPAPKKRPGAATKECPNCTAAVPPNATQCRCGYGLSTASLEMASLSLDAGALAILRR